jgi:hypothetical protein
MACIPKSMSGPTHRKKVSGPRTWRTRIDPFEHVWPIVQQWLEEDPGASAKALLGRLTNMLPELYAGTAQLRTLQRRVQQWRSERATKLIVNASLDIGSIKPPVIMTRDEVNHVPVQ